VAKQKRDTDKIRNLATLATEGDMVAREQFAELVKSPNGKGFCGPAAGRPSADVDAALKRWVA
jgi:hypothetical protein